MAVGAVPRSVGSWPCLRRVDDNVGGEGRSRPSPDLEGATAEAAARSVAVGGRVGPPEGAVVDRAAGSPGRWSAGPEAVWAGRVVGSPAGRVVGSAARRVVGSAPDRVVGSPAGRVVGSPAGRGAESAGRRVVSTTDPPSGAAPGSAEIDRRRSIRSSRCSSAPSSSERRGQQHPGAQQLQHQPRRGGAAHLDQPGVQDLGEPGERAGAEPVGLRRPSRRAGRRGRRSVPWRPRPAPPARITRSRSRCSRSAANRRGSCPASTTLSTAPNTEAPSPAASASTISSSSAASVTPSSATAFAVGHALGPGAGQQLVEHRQRVTRRTTAGLDHQREHRRLDRHALLGAQPLEQRAQRRRAGCSRNG